MSLASRLTALVQAIGADVKKLNEVSMLRPVDAAAVGNVDISSAPSTTEFDDVTGASWMTGRVLLHKQTNPAENGIWLYDTQGAPLTRADDVLKVKNGQMVYVRVGKTYGGKMFVSTKTAGPAEQWGFVPLPYSAESIAEPCMKVYEAQQSLTVAILDGSFEGRRVLLTAQTDKQENGVYTYDANNERLLRVTGEIYSPGRLFPVVTQSAIEFDTDWTDPQIWACTEIGGTEGYTFSKVSGSAAAGSSGTGASLPIRQAKSVVGATFVDFDGLEGDKAQQFRISVRGAHDAAPGSIVYVSVLPNKASLSGVELEAHQHQTYNSAGTPGIAPTHDTSVVNNIIPITRTYPAGFRCALSGTLTIDAAAPATGQRNFFGGFEARKMGAGDWRHIGGETHGWVAGTNAIDSLRIQFGQAFTGAVVVESLTNEGIGSPVTTAKRVKGRVSSAGAVVAGTGFSALRNAVGDYTVAFNPVFGTPPIVGLAIEGAAGALSHKLLSTPTANTFRVLIYNSTTGANVDSGFGFIAEEPGLGLQATMDVGAWQTPTPQNSWLNMLGTYPPVMFRIDPTGRVTVRGGIKSGLMQYPAFTLPVGYRPKYDVRVPAYSYNGSAQVQGMVYVQASTGQVTPWYGSNAEFNFDFSFFTD